MSFSTLLEQLNKNDKIIIADNNGEAKGVLLKWEAYQELLNRPAEILSQNNAAGLTSDKLLAKINQDIAQWKETQEPGSLGVDDFVFDDPFYLETIDCKENEIQN